MLPSLNASMVTQSARSLIASSLLGLGVLVAFFARYEKKKKKIKALQNRLLEATQKIVQKENEKALLVRDLQSQLEKRRNEHSSLIKANEEIAQKENEKAWLVRDLQKQLEQKEDEHTSVVKARDEIAQKDNQKTSLIKDLQNQLEKKENERATLIQVNQEVVQKDTEKALLIMDLQKQLAWSKKEYAQKAAEHASLVRDFEQQLAKQVNDEIAQKESELVHWIHSQPQVDGETWQFQGDSGEWVSFPDCANKALMGKLGEGHDMCDIVIDGKTYEIDFTKSSQMNQRTKKKRKIRCFFDLPSHWQMTNDDALKFLKDILQARPWNGLQWSWQMLLRLHPHGSTPRRPTTFLQPMLPVTDQDVKSRLGDLLNKSLSRHDGNHCNCLHGRSNFVVTEAYQVNNLPLWRRYQRFVRSIQDKHKQHGISLKKINPSVSEALTDFAKQINVDLGGNERLLLHGTRDFEVAKVIAAEGFDNRIARDGLFGKGTYFAAQTCKSAQYATTDGMRRKASPQMVGTMLIARVAIGDPFYTEGPCKTLTRPPIKNGVRADSIIAKPGIPNGQPAGVQSHMEVVTFDPAQAYPEFVIRFTEE